MEKIIYTVDIGSDNFILEKCTYIEMIMNKILLHSLMMAKCKILYTYDFRIWKSKRKSKYLLLQDHNG